MSYAVNGHGYAMRYITIVALLFIPFSMAEVYVWVDEKGKKHFSDKKPAAAKNQAKVREVFIEAPPEIDEIALQRQRNLLRFLESVEAQSEQEKRQAKTLRIKKKNSCAKVRRAIAKDNLGGVYYSYDSKGNKKVWSHEQREAYSAKLLKSKQNFCS